MSQKIVTNLFRYATGSGADSLTVNARPGQVTLDCRLPGGRVLTLAIPPRLEEEFLIVLRRLLQLAPGELVAGRAGKLRHKDCQFDFRLIVRPDKDGEKIVVSIVNNPSRLWRLNQLGLSTVDLRVVKDFLQTGSGLMAVSSPARQGKSATLSALLLEQNDPQRNVYWLSNGSEVAGEIAGVNYLPASPAIWEKILNHDSDLIFSDDLPDDRSIAYALRAAATGRSVIIALKADTAGQARDQILAVAAQNGFPAAVLKLVLNQRLADWPHLESKRTTGQRTLIGRFDIWRPRI